MKILLIAIFLFTATAYAQPLTPDDVKAFRQALADRDFYKQRAENAEAVVTALTASRDQWRALYEAEKVRADTIQGGRIGQLQAALDIAKVQMDADRQKIGELNADIIRLKAGRKWWAIMGLAAGGVAGYYIGTNQDRIINTITPANRPANFKLRF